MKVYLTSIAANVLAKIDLEGKQNVAFIPTAADPYDDRSFVDLDREALVRVGLEVVDYNIKGKNRDQIQKELSEFDIIFVAGGNSFYLLEKIRECGLDMVLPDLVKKGIIYIGSSAGSVVLCPDIEYVSTLDNPELGNGLEGYGGINLVDFYILPHYGHEKYASKFKLIQEKYSDIDLITITDDELVVVDESGYRKI